jgi:hypothetical protein
MKNKTVTVEKMLKGRQKKESSQEITERNQTDSLLLSISQKTEYKLETTVLFR